MDEPGTSKRPVRRRLSVQDIEDILNDSDEDFSVSGSEFSLGDETEDSDEYSDEASSEDGDFNNDVSRDTVEETGEGSEMDVDGQGVDGGSRYNGRQVSPGNSNGRFKWVLNGNQKHISYIGEEKVNMPEPRGELTPFGAYQCFVTDDVIDYMVQCTNENAKLYLESHQVKRSSRLANWSPTSREEMIVFLGLRIWMGLVKMPQYTDYWSNATVFKNDFASKKMTRNRFQLLLRFWHFGPDDPESGRLHKIQPLIDKLTPLFSSMKSPGKFLVVDESMIHFRGRISFRQYMPQKASKYGIKVFKICDPIGYTFNLLLYKGKGTFSSQGGESMPTKVVMQLVSPYLHSGRVLCTDNYYTSMELLTTLLQADTHLIGTFRKNRKGFPKEVVNAKLKKGDVKALQEESTGAIAMKWRDKRDVYMVSTCYTAELVPAPSPSGKKRTSAATEKLKPNVVNEYNAIKGGIDISDTLESYYSTERKSIRWYHKVADSLLFGTCIVNAFIMWNETRAPNAKKTSLKQFRKEIVEGMLNIPSTSCPNRASKESTHYLEKVEEKTSSGQTKRNRCRGCYEKLAKNLKSVQAKKMAKKVTTRCSTCPDKPFFCLTCFEEVHSKY